jgi:hypothetical protein
MGIVILTSHTLLNTIFGKIILFPHAHLFPVSPLNNYLRNKLKLNEEQIPEIGNKQTI